MRRALRLLPAALAPVLAGWLGACGGGEHVAARVGDATITAANVRAQIVALAPEHIVPDPPRFARCIARLSAGTPGFYPGQIAQECRSQYTLLKQQALGALIDAQWLLGAASERGLDVSGGSPTTKARAAEAALRRSIQGDQSVGQTEVAAYYHKNSEDYETPEQREIYIVEHIPTRQDAQALLAQTRRAGKASDVKIRPPVIGLEETLPKMNPAELPPPRRAVLRAVLAAKPHMIVGPVPLNEQWCFFEVRLITPRAVKSLAEVSNEIRQQLISQRQKKALTSYIAAWRKKWTARTDCSPGYVIQKCRQYRGPRTPEDPHSFR
jgi:hypothetical protein